MEPLSLLEVGWDFTNDLHELALSVPHEKIPFQSNELASEGGLGDE